MVESNVNGIMNAERTNNVIIIAKIPSFLLIKIPLVIVFHLTFVYLVKKITCNERKTSSFCKYTEPIITNYALIS